MYIWLIYVNVDSPNLGFPYFNFLGGYQWKKKHPVNRFEYSFVSKIYIRHTLLSTLVYLSFAERGIWEAAHFQYYLSLQ